MRALWYQKMTADNLQHTPKSFVIRSGRMTKAQQKALDQHWRDNGLSVTDGFIDQPTIFGRMAPLVLEIGFGMGLSLAEMAEKQADIDFIGVDVHKPGVGNLLREIHNRRLNNIRIYYSDALTVIDRCLTDLLLDRIQLYFPDPWPKRRHHKRRLVQPEFIANCRNKLKIGGVLHMATDWEPYALHMLEVMQAAKGYQNDNKAQAFAERPDYRPTTKFEKRAKKLGHRSWDLIFRRVS